VGAITNVLKVGVPLAALGVGTGFAAAQLSDATRDNDAFAVPLGIASGVAGIAGVHQLLKHLPNTGPMGAGAMLGALALGAGLWVAGDRVGAMMAGDGKAEPIHRVDDLAQSLFEPAERFAAVAGKPLPADREAIAAKLRTFDRYAEHGAAAGDGQLTREDIKALKEAHPSIKTWPVSGS
jgi:hypothetical protein